MRAVVICNRLHFVLDKSTYTDVFLDKASFLFMQVNELITKYAKIAYL